MSFAASTFVYAGFSDPVPSVVFDFLTWGIFGDDNTKAILNYYKVVVFLLRSLSCVNHCTRCHAMCRRFCCCGVGHPLLTSLLVWRAQNITDIPATADGRTWFSRVLTDYWFRCASEVFATAVTNSGSDAFVCVVMCCAATCPRCVRLALQRLMPPSVSHAPQLPL